MSERADLKAPCVFCSYNGPRYWQKCTHHSLCPWYNLAGVNDRKNALRGVMQRLLAQDGLRAAAQGALEHLEELREAWRRGVIDERDGQGGTRSNRNVAVSVNLRAALCFERPVTARPEVRAPLEGKWAAEDLRRAFVEGAKWWEWHTENATMWPEDVNRAETEAEKRHPMNNGSSKE